MALKFLKNRDSVLESWFNPVLSGETNQASNILPPGSYNPLGAGQNMPNSANYGPDTADMIEKPAWLDNDDPTIMRNGDILSIGAFYLNGIPLSTWSANFSGQASYQQKQTMTNWYYLDQLTKHMFPDGIKAYMNQGQETEYNISKLTIVRMAPNSNAIGLNVYVKFNINDIEIWGKFENVGIDAKPKFICGDVAMDSLPIETKIKITGKIWNTMLAWFKAKTGIYKCLAKDVLVYSELGQLKKISEGNIIEVLSADENKIKFKYDDTTYFVKKPTYYWFNWYFQKH